MVGFLRGKKRGREGKERENGFACVCVLVCGEMGRSDNIEDGVG